MKIIFCFSEKIFPKSFTCHLSHVFFCLFVHAKILCIFFLVRLFHYLINRIISEQKKKDYILKSEHTHPINSDDCQTSHTPGNFPETKKKPIHTWLIPEKNFFSTRKTFPAKKKNLPNFSWKNSNGHFKCQNVFIWFEKLDLFFVRSGLSFHYKI